MRKLIESVVFILLASAIHLGLWGPLDEGGAQSAGMGGEDLLTIMPATASVAQMVRDWETPIETQTDLTLPEPPQPDTPPLPEIPDLPPPAPREPAPLELPKLPEITPPPSTEPQDAPPRRAMPEPVVEPEAEPRTRPDTPRPTLRDVTTHRTTAVERERERSLERPPRPERPAPDSRASNAAVASGTGGGVAAGNRGTAEAATLTTASRNSLLAQWGAKIRARVARRAPRGAGKGTAVVAITVSGSGALLSASLHRSSGNSRVDQLALAAVRKAAPFPAAPGALAITRHSFALPIKSR